MSNNNHVSTPSADEWPRGPVDWFRGMAESWNRFWFTPTDPTLWSWIRIGTGLLAVYTLLSFGLDFNDYFGPDGWMPLEKRLQYIRNSPTYADGPDWPRPQEEPKTKTKWEDEYVAQYRQKFGEYPPLPFPADDDEARDIENYRLFWGVDPRRLLARGNYYWSVYYHVTDPVAMAALHSFLFTCAVLFTVGLGTRFFAVLTWAGMLQYIHRTPIMLFGFDTMMIIVLMYLMLVPCGARYSVDAWLRRWWHRHRPVVVWNWKQFWARLGRRPDPGSPPPLNETPPPVVQPSLAANFALRMLQIHVCIIYGAAGLAKLKGGAWWGGTAIWGTLGCPEFAPLYLDSYLWFLRHVASYRLYYEVIAFSGTYFTLFFEIGYPFLVWRPGMRWLMLSMAILMHGFIGIFMGLKTFALIMIIMNMAFLPPNAVAWVERVGRQWFGGDSPADGSLPAEPAVASVPVLHASGSGEYLQRRGRQ